MIAFWCYDPSDLDDGGIHGWYDEQPPEFRAEIDGALEVLAREKGHGTAPQLKPLRGACAGLTEVKIDFGGRRVQIHLRILGYEATPRVFVLLTGFRKSGSADYGAACRSAHTRKRGVQKDGRRAKPCRFP
jgi:hypothetical protein